MNEFDNQLGLTAFSPLSRRSPSPAPVTAPTGPKPYIAEESNLSCNFIL